MFKKLHESATDPITLYVDGQAVIAERGETVAAVLLREEQHASRLSAVGGEPRAPFCMMGVCFDCLAIVDGVSSTQTCLATAQEGMRVERQLGRKKVTI